MNKETIIEVKGRRALFEERLMVLNQDILDDWVKKYEIFENEGQKITGLGLIDKIQSALKEGTVVVKIRDANDCYPHIIGIIVHNIQRYTDKSKDVTFELYSKLEDTPLTLRRYIKSEIG